MTTPKLELVMAAIVAKIAAINDSSVPSPNLIFNYVTRQVIIGQNLQQSQKPACGIQRLIDRNDRAFDSPTSQKTKLIFQLQISASETNKELIDTQLVTLKEYLDNAFLNCTLGGLVSAITYFGADSSNFVAIPQASELVTYECTIAKSKPSLPNG
jgi:hypothetical protein